MGRENLIYNIRKLKIKNLKWQKRKKLKNLNLVK